MPVYQVTLIYSLFDQGWTETYYRPANSARAATDFGGESGLAPWLQFRPRECMIDAIRANEVDGLRRVFTRLVQTRGGPFLDPDITSVCARLYVNFNGGSGRHLYLRGLSDSQVKRDERGRDVPGSTFFESLERLRRRFRDLNLAGRRTVQTEKFRLFSLAPFPGNSLFAIATVDPDFKVAAGEYVDLGGPLVIGIPREKRFLVVEADIPGTVIISYQWPEDFPSITADRDSWIRVKRFEYPGFSDVRFSTFSKYSTRSRYRPVSWQPLVPLVSALNPCGSIVDFLRQCYTCEMRINRDDAATTIPVVWYFVDDLAGADRRRAIPYEHPFASRNWDLNQEYETVLGEVYSPRPWYNGRAPVELSGIGLCGSAAAWMNGAGSLDSIPPLNRATGQPCCCGPGAVSFTGGPSISGGLPYCAAPEWNIFFDGITNGTCPDCDQWNGTFRLLPGYSIGDFRNTDPCQWSSEPVPFCSGEQQRFYMFYLYREDRWLFGLINPGSTGLFRYEVPSDQWIPFGTNTGPMQGAPSPACNGFPASASIWTYPPKTNSLKTNLVLSLPMNEESGPLIDRLGANNFTEQNPPVGSGVGVIDGSRIFLLANQQGASHVDNPTLSAGTGPIALSVWFKPYDFNVNYPIAMKSVTYGSLASTEWYIRLTNTGLIWIETAGASGLNTIITSKTAVLNEWNHVGFNLVPGTAFHVWLNGRRFSTFTSRPSRDSTQPFRIATTINPAISFNGELCELNFWKRGLSIEEWTAIYHFGEPFPFADWN